MILGRSFRVPCFQSLLHQLPTTAPTIVIPSNLYSIGYMGQCILRNELGLKSEKSCNVSKQAAGTFKALQEQVIARKTNDNS